MTEHEILEFEKRCAEFLGYKLITPLMRKEPHNWSYAYWEYKDKANDHISKKVLGREGYIGFHSNWNLIMWVVDAIEELGFNTDSYSPISINEEGYYEFNIWDKINTEIEGRGSTRKESYVDAINKFLIWYNETR